MAEGGTDERQADRTMTRAGFHIPSRGPSQALAAALLALALGALPAGPARAQDGGLFAPRVTVNGAVVSNYEFEQRVLFLRALRAPGDPEREALRGLIEDRLSQQAAEAAGISVTPEQIAEGMTEFASRANLSAEDFAAALAQEGIAPETFRDFVTAGLLWREVVRERFVGTVNFSEAQVDRALAETARRTEIEVLISEIVLPAEGEAASATVDEARRIRDAITSGGGFDAAARTYSASPSAARGGRLDWMPLSNLPPAIAQRLLLLDTGEVADPFVAPQAVVLFQLNGINETDTIAPAEVRVQWAEYVPAAGEDAAMVQARADACGDLNALARGRGEGALVLRDATMATVPADTGLTLARLDPGEVAALGGRLVMLCAREGLSAPPEPAAGPAADAAANAAPDAAAEAPAPDPDLGGLVANDRGEVRAALLNQTVALKAAAWMEELRSEAIITGP
ncbi:MAG: hypothetical protein RIR62_165 [Pseudomonadota bacterium]